MDLSREDVAAITGGTVERGSVAPVVMRGVSFDSRTLVPGEGFVALRDERDGHDFVGAAFAAGAALALVERVPDGTDGPLVVVDDTRAALRALGVAARDRIEGATVVGVTGSAGKTSTKDLTAAALAPRTRVHASAASFNNEIGLPVTLLATPSGVEAVVLEMGARFAGNIGELCAIARPNVGVVTHIGLAHAEHLGGPAGIAAVKGELLDALPTDGLAVLNADCPSTAALRTRTTARVITAGAAPGADVRASDVRLDDGLRARFHLDSPWGAAEVRLAVRGAYQVENAALAATVALAHEVPMPEVVDALANAGTAAWRMELHTRSDGLVVLNDSYNASPTSMRASLAALAALSVSGRRIAVLGEMRELGSIAASEHATLGDLVSDAGVAILIVVGPGTDELAAAAAAQGVEVHPADDHVAAVGIVRALAGPGDAVLVKASRAVGLERVADALVATGEATGATR